MLLHDLLVPPLHLDIPHVVTDMLRLQLDWQEKQRHLPDKHKSKMKKKKSRSHPPMVGLVDVVLPISHHAEHHADDSQRKDGLQPK